MSVLNDREKRYEGKFSHTEEVEFKIISRRAKLTGLWAAERIGFKDEEAERYAKTVVEAELKEPGHQDMIDKLKKDFEDHKINVSDHRLQKVLDETYEIAREQIMNES